MPNVKLSRADWDWVLMVMNDCEYRGHINDAIIDEINAQLDGQEY